MHVRWRGLELPSVVDCDRQVVDQNLWQISLPSLLKEVSEQPSGNSLRRILLSSLEGSAITQLKIRGANHEFSSIPGVLEDVTDIVLNVKSLVVKNHTDQMKVITIEKETEGPVTGADIQTGGEVDIINADHTLVTLTDNVPFMMEMVVENGRGYVPATEHSGRDHEVGNHSYRCGLQPRDACSVRCRRNACRPEDEL
jgi:DNA-directed RNA polymerase subunit alpha